LGQAIGQVLSLAVGVAISPVPIIAVVLMLVTPRARSDGPAFVVGWLLGLSIVGTIVLLAAPDATNDSGGPATWVSTLKLVLGVLLVLLALKQWRGRPHAGEEPPTPKWMGAIDAFTAPKALGAGAVLSGANPKNLLLAVGAAAAIVQTGISGGEQAVAYAVFAVLATVGVAVPVVIYFALGDRAGAILNRLKTWLAKNNAAIMAVLLLVIGVKLIGDAISGFST
jgi:threonine/homoserine/homoserine lactone efflux protein